MTFALVQIAVDAAAALGTGSCREEAGERHAALCRVERWGMGRAMEQTATVEAVRGALGGVFSELGRWCRRPDEVLLARPPYPDAWTAAEHLEHVGLVNHFLLLTIAKGCRQALKRAGRLPVPPGESDLAPLAPVAQPGAFAWPPPAHMLPTGERTPQEVHRQLAQQYQRCLELLERMPHGEGRLTSFRMSVHNLGRLDLYQWLYFLAQHGRYHLNFLGQRGEGETL